MDGGAGWDPCAVQSRGVVGLEPSGRALEGRVRAEGGGGWEKGCHDNLLGFPRKPGSP